MNLSEWAEKSGVSKFTAYRWFREGKLPIPAQRVGRLILLDVMGTTKEIHRNVIYYRVSSHDQRRDLDRHVARLTQWATEQGLSVDEVVSEVGSAMNGKRPKFARVLSDSTATTIIVEHRDRLARFGTEHLQAVLSAQDRQVLIMENTEMDDDLVRDMTEVLTSFCARLYGKRSARNRAIKALNCAKQDIGPQALSHPHGIIQS